MWLLPDFTDSILAEQRTRISHLRKRISVKRYFCRRIWSISSARGAFSSSICRHLSRCRPGASGNRLEDNTLNASPLPGSNVRDVRNFRRRINPPFPQDIPGAESSKVSSDSTDVGRTCCLSCLPLSHAVFLHLALSPARRPFRSRFRALMWK